MFFKQIRQHGDNFSYIIADEATNEAAAIDSSYNANEIIRQIKERNLNVKYIINTHGHSDHTSGNKKLQQAFAAAKVIAYKSSQATHDVSVVDGDILQIGNIPIEIIFTPGHTTDSICLLVDNRKLLTGDTLFVGECGRTDLPGGSSESLFNSLFNKLARLEDKVEVYPGHDYGKTPSSTIGEEKKSNYVLQPRSLQDFVTFMSAP